MKTLEDVIRYIDSLDDDETFNRLLDSMEEARVRLERQREAAVHLDDFVTVEGVTPTYLNGLQGEVLWMEVDDESGEREASVRLTPQSTGSLRFAPGNDRYDVGDVDRYVLPRVPLSCCTPTAETLPLNPNATAEIPTLATLPLVQSVDEDAEPARLRAV